MALNFSRISSFLGISKREQLSTYLVRMLILSRHNLINLPLGSELIPPLSIFEIVFLLKPRMILREEAAISYFSLNSIISIGAIEPFAIK